MAVGPKFYDQWKLGFGLTWELDFWGRLRRQITEAGDQLDASVADYDGVMVTMLGDIAQAYMKVRTDQERIRVLQANVDLQRGVLRYIETRFKAGFKQTELDFDQAVSKLKQTEAQIPPWRSTAEGRRPIVRLAGHATGRSGELAGDGPIPAAPPEVAIGIPADLLRRRPDVRQAERLAAAQAEQIGIAQADLYPIFTLNGQIGYQAQDFRDMFSYRLSPAILGRPSNGNC